MDFLNLIISLISGAVGGNIAGAALKDRSLGTVGNSISAAASAACSCKPLAHPSVVADSTLDH